MDNEELIKALEGAARQDQLIAILCTLAKEYEAKAITAERFALRCYEELGAYRKVERHDDIRSE